MCCQPFISVVIPTYNRIQQTIAAIKSVLAQTYPKYEVIVIDDGSTDGSSEHIEKFVREKANVGNQVSYFRQANGGPGSARNEGIKRARGEYIAFLDSDDLWLPEKLDWQVRTLEQFKEECGACFTDAKCVDSDGMDIRSFQWFKRSYKRPVGIDNRASESIAQAFCGFWISTLLARTELLRQIGGFDPKIFFCEDRDLYYRLSLNTLFAYVNIPLVLTDRTISSPESVCRSWDKWDVRLKGEQRMYEGWLKLGGAVRLEMRKTIVSNLRATHSGWANWYLGVRRYGEARREMSKAMTYAPTVRTAIKWLLVWLAPALTKTLFGDERIPGET
jgi:glycosyltransferase involved in cell wall biosynthesis